MRTFLCAFLPLKVVFQVRLEVSECLKEPKTFRIKLQGISEEVKVTVETNCDCNCGLQEKFSEQCSGKGDLTCGVCRYNPPVVLAGNYKLLKYTFISFIVNRRVCWF